MLREAQVAELLRRCGSLLGLSLAQVKGNLRRAKTRAAQVWELLLLESLSKIADGVLYEPKDGGSPDFLLQFHNKESIWVETTWLYPSNDGVQERTSLVTQWLWREALRKGIDPVKLVPDFHRDERGQANEVERLPMSHQPREFANNHELVAFWEVIKQKPDSSHSLNFSDYALRIEYNPNLCGHIARGIGPVDKRIQCVDDHPLYKKICEKGKQHSPSGKYIVWIGGQNIPSIGLGGSGYGVMSARRVISAAMRAYPNVSAVVVTEIQSRASAFSRSKGLARSEISLNQRARFPLGDWDVAAIQGADLNRWSFGFSLDQSEGGRDHLRMLGDAALSYNGDEVDIEVGGALLARVFAGHLDVVGLLGDEVGRMISARIEAGYFVSECQRVEADHEAGRPEGFKLRISPPKDDVFWPVRAMKGVE